MKVRWQLLAIFLIAVGTPVASTLLYIYNPPEGTTNRGELIAAVELPPAVLPDNPFVDEVWHLLVAGPAACDLACQVRLCKIRQARLVNFGDRLRVGRLWALADDGAVPAALSMEPSCGTRLITAIEPVDLLDEVMVVEADAGVELPPAAAGHAADYIYVVDPQGRIMMRYGADVSVKDIARDLRRLLKLSQRGG